MNHGYDDTGMSGMFKEESRTEFQVFFSNLVRNLNKKDFAEEEITEEEITAILKDFKDFVSNLYDFYWDDPVGFEDIVKKVLEELNKVKMEIRSDKIKELILTIEKKIEKLLAENKKTPTD